jgi:hypothetical protein
VERSFVDEAQNLRILPNPDIDRTTTTSNKNQFTRSEKDMFKALRTVSEVFPGPNHHRSEDANILIILLSFLSTSGKITKEFLSRGATPRVRWSSDGMTVETAATGIGLTSELCNLLSDLPRLDNAFDDLETRAIVSKHADETYSLSSTIPHRLHRELSVEQLSYWKCQALIVVYRTIPWKYIEPL